MRLAIIPARGGSKRIPRKNIKVFAGLPIIAWSIKAAMESQCFDRIIVSTDDMEIAELAKAYGAEVPFIRPVELSDDQTATIPVIAHAVDWQSQHGPAATEVCCIYATAPFVQASDLQNGLQVLRRSGADYAISVTSYAFPIQRAIRITPDQRVEMFQPEHFSTRSQDLDEAWHDAMHKPGWQGNLFSLEIQHLWRYRATVCRTSIPLKTGCGPNGCSRR